MLRRVVEVAVSRLPPNPMVVPNLIRLQHLAAAMAHIPAVPARRAIVQKPDRVLDRKPIAQVFAVTFAKMELMFLPIDERIQTRTSITIGRPSRIPIRIPGRKGRKQNLPGKNKEGRYERYRSNLVASSQVLGQENAAAFAIRSSSPSACSDHSKQHKTTQI